MCQVDGNGKCQNYSYYKSITLIPHCVLSPVMGHLGLKTQSMVEQKIKDPENYGEISFFLTYQSAVKGWLVNMEVETPEAKNADTSQITRELS